MADGTFLGPKFQLSTAFDEQLWPAATWDGTQFVAAWEDKRNSVVHFDERTDIYGARVTADGVVLDPGGIPLVAEPEVEIRPTFMTTTGGTTLMAVSTLRSDDASTGAFRLGIHEMSGEFCQADLGFAGPGDAVLSVCGEPLVSGATADLVLTGAAPNSVAWLVASLTVDPQPFMGGTLVPLPILLQVPVITDATGGHAIPGFSGGGGPVDVCVQFAVEDATQPFGFAMSNAVTVELLP